MVGGHVSVRIMNDAPLGSKSPVSIFALRFQSLPREHVPFVSHWKFLILPGFSFQPLERREGTKTGLKVLQTKGNIGNINDNL